jgi:hypothetical protein
MENLSKLDSKKKSIFYTYTISVSLLSIGMIVYSILFRNDVFITPYLFLLFVLAISLFFLDLTRQEMIELKLDFRFIKRNSFVAISYSLVVFIALITTIVLSVLRTQLWGRDFHGADFLEIFHFIGIFVAFLIIICLLFSSNLYYSEILLNTKKTIFDYQMKSVYSTNTPLITFIIGLCLFIARGWRGGSIVFSSFTAILVFVIFTIELVLIDKFKKKSNRIPFVPKNIKKLTLLKFLNLFSLLFFLVFYILTTVKFCIFDLFNMYPAISSAMAAFSIISLSTIILISVILLTEIRKKT